MKQDLERPSQSKMLSGLVFCVDEGIVESLIVSCLYRGKGEVLTIVKV